MVGVTAHDVAQTTLDATLGNINTPSVWIDPKSGNNYFLTVQYKEAQIKDLADIRAIPLHGANLARKNDVVVVTVNHRLNLFGYLHLGDLGGHPSSGMAGMACTADVTRPGASPASRSSATSSTATPPPARPAEPPAPLSHKPC